MAWSTHQLAELAGATVNTIRHYHRVGILEEPERRHNGYKQYEIRHLIRLLRIRRLVELGVPLNQIGSDGDIDPELLRRIDADLAAEAERLARTRSDLAVILRDGAPADMPAGFESLARRLSASDTSLIHVYTRLYDDGAMNDLREMAGSDISAADEDFDALPPDADDETRQGLAEKLAPSIVRHLIAYPWLSDPADHVSNSAQVTQRTFVDAVVALYNPAQVDVLGRASVLAQQQLREARERDENQDSV
ncbi:MerR family transcriptional regulator [Paractinoplanes maris]|uniref:helix-turn-helix domain-containing protein n=1 Tax=Paractinoplanes maris TaxID=1734446 RepID=UPI002021B06C|nr:MerR family transcriptional regulator [Actinoplanes maris]